MRRSERRKGAGVVTSERAKAILGDVPGCEAIGDLRPPHLVAGGVWSRFSTDTVDFWDPPATAGWAARWPEAPPGGQDEAHIPDSFRTGPRWGDNPSHGGSKRITASPARQGGVARQRSR